MVKSIDIALRPAEVEPGEADCYIVVDLLRATTMIATLFGRGLAELTATNDIEFARRLSREQKALLLGEVGGPPPPDFDGGNSPVEAAAMEVSGRTAVQFTTNGTKALCRLAGDGMVLTGALANLSAVAAAAGAYDRVLVVCAGNNGGERWAMDDLVGSAAIAGRIAAASPGATLGEGARLGRELLATVPAAELVRNATHAGHLKRIGLGHDIEYALREDTSAAVPGVVACGEGWATLRDLSPSR